MAFEEEGAVDMGASFLDRGGRRFWFCSPPCEREFRAEPAKHGG
jgi:YHS domain-containing protein